MLAAHVDQVQVFIERLPGDSDLLSSIGQRVPNQDSFIAVGSRDTAVKTAPDGNLLHYFGDLALADALSFGLLFHLALKLRARITDNAS